MESPANNVEFPPTNMEFPRRGMKRKLTNYVQPFEEKKPATYTLSSAKKIVQYSFIVQRSLTYLDLSLCELSKSKRKMKKHKYLNVNVLVNVKSAIVTEEDCKKRFAYNRYVLYIYHLDVPKELDGSLRYPGCQIREYFYSEKVLPSLIEVLNNIHDILLNGIITEIYRERENKVQFIHSVSKLMNAKFISQNNCIRNSGLTYLCFHCEDSNIIKDFLISMGFDGDHFFNVALPVFEKVLHHAQRTGYDLYALAPYKDPIHSSILYHAFMKTVHLFQYRSAPKFCEAAYNSIRVGHSMGVPEIALYIPVHNKRMSRERHFLIMEVIYCYIKKLTESLDPLRMLWRSISDPYISLDELSAVLFRVPDQNHIYYLSAFLKQITEEAVTERCQPRKLRHYCRTAIRNMLWKNNEPLPTVIGKLKVPPELKVFLQLKT